MRALPLILLVACEARTPEDFSEWFHLGDPLDVEEHIDFTSEPYDFPEDRRNGIERIERTAFNFESGFGTHLAPENFTPAVSECDNWAPLDSLPRVIEGIVTAHPRMYFKTHGCTRDDEKYYGSYFIEDRTGGLFVLGDSKVAHFDIGAKVRLRVRGTRTSFGVSMIYLHDVVAIDHGPFPVSYVAVERPFDERDVGKVRRVTGTISAEPDTFGTAFLQPDGYDAICAPPLAEDCALISLDMELNRRGISFTAGERVTVTGPILFSYDEYSLVLTRVGQIERHDP